MVWKKGTIEITETVSCSKIWKYTTATGESVEFVDGRIVFPKEYLFKDSSISDFFITEFTGDRAKDKVEALKVLDAKGYDSIPDGYVLHHDVINGHFQLVREDIHMMFPHYGGVYYSK